MLSSVKVFLVPILCTIIFFLCPNSAQIIREDGNTLILKNIVDILGNLSLQLKAQETNLVTKMRAQETNLVTKMRELETQMHSKLQDLETRMDSKLQEHLLECQQCAQRDDLVSLQSTLSTGQQQLGNDIKDLLAKDEECMEGTHNCSEMATCACLPGYTGDGYKCQDIDECREGTNSCNPTQECVNIPGGYNCHCQVGYRQQGITCQDIDECSEKSATCHGTNVLCLNNPGSYVCHNCESPTLYLEELGCISLINSRMSWDAAKTKCQEEGKRLLEEIQYKHLEPLAKHFHPILPKKIYDVGWIGLQNSRWVTSGEEVTHALWRRGEPNGGGDACAWVALKPGIVGFSDVPCSRTYYALCQALPY